MDDFPDEKEQWERLQAYVRENGPWIAAGLIVGAAALWGWRTYQAYVERQALEASLQYEQVLDAFGRADSTQGAALIAKLEREHPRSPYVDQAELAAARMAVLNNELDRAAADLEAVMTRTRDPELALVARLRLARVELAGSKPDQALATVRAAPAGSAFAPSLAEARGDALLAKGDRAGALAAYREASRGPAGTVDTAALDLKMRDLASP